MCVFAEEEVERAVAGLEQTYPGLNLDTTLQHQEKPNQETTHQDC